MKTIKIFAVPSHAAKERVSGVDFARVIQPMTHLNNQKGFKVQIYDPKLNEKMDWLQVTAENDILFLNYTTNPWSFAIMGCLARKHKRIIVLDMDDALWDVLQDNTAYEVFKEGSEGIKNFTSICNEVDYVTCTNSYLRNVIVHNTRRTYDKISIFPNYVDLSLYSHRAPFKDTHTVQLTHFGSSSHFKSLQNEEFNKGIDRIFKEYPNVVLKTVGALIPKYKNRWGQRYEHGFGDVDVLKWIKDKFPKFMDETDIIVAPLTENIYNKCKSDIKRSEACSAKKPFIGQDIRQYQEAIEDGVDGFLARRAEDWYGKIKALIDDKELRRKMGEAGFERVKKTRQMKDHAKDYASFFKSILAT